MLRTSSGIAFAPRGTHGRYTPRLKKPAPPRLTDTQWDLVKWVILNNDPIFRYRRSPSRRDILDAILYHEITGSAWNRLPETFPDDTTVYNSYVAWKRCGLLETVYALLCAEERAR